MSGAVTAVAAVVATKAVVDMMTPSKPAPQQQAAAGTNETINQQPGATAPQQPAAPVEPPAPVYNTVMRDAPGNQKAAMSPQAVQARRGGGASGSTMLTGARGAPVGAGDLGSTSLLGQ